MTQSSDVVRANGHQSANLGDILERVLDRGIVIAGDIKVNLLDIELLTIKLRLLIVSVDTAREIGIDWWEHDPWLSSRGTRPAVESGGQTRPSVDSGGQTRATVESGARTRPAVGAEQRDELDR